MRINNYLFNDELVSKLNSPNINLVTLPITTGAWVKSIGFLRFEEKKEKYTWAHPDEIYFAISADHYVKALINCGNKIKWMYRHSTLKGLLDILPRENFIRLNKFYLLNLNYFSHINESKKLLYFFDGFSIAIPHRISPFLSRSLKSTYT